MIRYGRVIAPASKINERPGNGGSTTSSFASVLLEDLPACGRCASGRGCGISLLPQGHSELSANPALAIDCANPLGARPGQMVRVELPEPDNQWLMLVSGTYGLPTLGLLLGAMAGEGLSLWLAQSENGLFPLVNGELSATIGALIGMIGGIIAWRTCVPGQRLERLANPRLCEGRIVGVDIQLN